MNSLLDMETVNLATGRDTLKEESCFDGAVDSLLSMENKPKTVV